MSGSDLRLDLTQGTCEVHHPQHALECSAGVTFPSRMPPCEGKECVRRVFCGDETRLVRWDLRYLDELEIHVCSYEIASICSPCLYMTLDHDVMPSMLQNRPGVSALVLLL